MKGHSGISNIRSKGSTGHLHHGRDHAARDHARRHRGRRASRRRALPRPGGKNAILPLVGRRIPIVADEYSDPEKGTGAVKITPAHDFNDFEVGRRHNLPLVNVLDVEANLNLEGNEAFLRDLPRSPELEETLAYHGLDRFVVRKEIVARMEAAGLLGEDRAAHAHGAARRSLRASCIEPFLTDQWYVDAKTLAQPAIAAVRDGRTVFVPRNWEATYFNWMENIQPWCISRQLWWGHQIPAWYGFTADEQGNVLVGSGQQFKSVVETFVAESEQEAIAQARKYYGADDVWWSPTIARRWRRSMHRSRAASRRSSRSGATRTCSTPGSPRRCGRSRRSAGRTRRAELERYYPTDVLVTGFDIIFFWVARMMMMGLHFMEEVPFHTVYIHALVRDAARRQDVEVERQRHRSAAS